MKNSRQSLILALLFGVIFLNSGCKKDPPVSIREDNTFTLTVNDVSCTEAWLTVHVGSGFATHTAQVMRDTVVLASITLSGTDTTIADTGLLPSHTYTYTAAGEGKTAQVQAKTMDTTSHNFTWATTTLGDGTGSSTLYDVAIINDTLAYACGAIYYGGSLCDLVKWNGHQWDTMHVAVTLTYTNSQIVTDQDPLKTIYAFNANDIWVVSQAGGVSHWNGVQWVMLSIPFNQGPGACNQMWGTSSSDLYFVGNNGRIIYYNGSSWTKIESGTSLDINGVYGDYNIASGQWEVLCVASNISVGPEREIIKINGTTAQLLNKTGIAGTLASTWFKAGRRYYVVGAGFYDKNDLNSANWGNGFYNITSYYLFLIKGNGMNDVVAAGGNGEVLHYNGITWLSYLSQTRLNNGNYYSVAFKGNLLIAVGENAPKAAIVMGRR
jgi:hypothetical protein